MFERRLRIILAIPILCLLVVITRLYQLQILHGEEYDQKADVALVCPRQYLPPLRGAITDRYGRVLVSDEPAIDVTVDYGALSLSDAGLLRIADRIRKREPTWRQASDANLVDEAKRRIGAMWATLARVSGRSIRELRERRDAVYDSVEGLRRFVVAARRERGVDEPSAKVHLKEEELFHAIVRDISPDARTRIELELVHWPFVRIEPSVRRVWHDGSRPLCHVLGQIGPVTAERIEADPNRFDPLSSYRADDEAGQSGVERLGEMMLRGQRGFEERYRGPDGATKERLAAKDGLDVQLTIDLDLQARIEEILVEAMAQHPASTGASCVVLDVSSREVLAAVSVPTFERTSLRENYRSLRDDAMHQPLRFRAVQDRFQPGSIIKPVALLAGFSHGLVDPAQRVFCGGALIPGAEKWHCWTHWRNMPGHGELNAEEALQHSCNIFFYTLGQKVGAHHLTDFYREFVLGPSFTAEHPEATEKRASEHGTRLIEESRGLIPSREWLSQHRHRTFTEADGRNYAIGQGEIQITPLQAANMFATLAVGEYRDPTLVANDYHPRPAQTYSQISAEAWRLMRRGLYRCVNEEGGTAFKYAHTDRLEICGKTGSAECVPRAIERRFTFEVPALDGGPPITRAVEAPTIEAARAVLGLPNNATCIGREITQRWPQGDFTRTEDAAPHNQPASKTPTHAWFAGFAPYRKPKIALAGIIEYGGGGGATAGPVAKSIFEVILDSPRGYLSKPVPVDAAITLGSSDE